MQSLPAKYLPHFLALAWLLILLPLARPFGEHPLNDDWYYYVPVQSILESGRFMAVDGHASWSFPQIFAGAAWAKVLGLSHWHLRAFGILIFAIAMLVVCQVLANSVKSATIRSVATVIIVTFLPVCANGFSFMSDIPFILFWLIACQVFEKAFDRPTWKHIAVAAAFAALSVAQRQFGILLAPTALVAAVFLGHQGSWVARLRPAILVAMTTAATFALCEYYWSIVLKVPAIMSVPTLNLGRSMWAGYISLCYAGFLTMPILILIATQVDYRASWGRRPRLVAGLAVLTLFLVATGIKVSAGQLMPFWRNQASQFGLFGPGGPGVIIPGDPGKLIPDSVALVLTVLAGLGAAGFVWVSIERLMRILKRQRAAGDFLYLATWSYLVGLLVLRDKFNDRYLLPFFFGAVIICAQDPRIEGLTVKVAKWPAKLAYAAVALLMLVGAYWTVVVMDDYMRWTAARWQAGEYLVSSQGVPASQIDGGHEWYINKIQLPSPESSFYIKAKKPQLARIEFVAPNRTDYLQVFRYSGFIRRGSVGVRMLPGAQSEK